MKKLLLLLTFLPLFSCAVYAPHPSKRPLSVELQGKLETVDVNLYENHNGVGMAWMRQDSSAAGSQYGLIGALTTAIIDAIANAGPKARASKAADEMAAIVSPKYLNDSFIESIGELKDLEPEQTVNYGKISLKPSILANTTNEMLEISLSYKLSQEASQLVVIATVSYSSDKHAYQTPYQFENNKTPKSQLSGPIYYNSFTYYSDLLELPTWSKDLEKELVNQIKERYTDDNGVLPTANIASRNKTKRKKQRTRKKQSKEFKAMTKELSTAQDGKLSKSEISTFLIRNWTANNGQLLLAELTKAGSFISTQIVKDLNRDHTPAMEGEDTILETTDEGREIKMIGSTRLAGSIESTPKNAMEFATWGNTTQYGKENTKTLKSLTAAAKKKKRSSLRESRKNKTSK